MNDSALKECLAKINGTIQKMQRKMDRQAEQIEFQAEEIDALKLTVSKLTTAHNTMASVVDVMKGSENYAKNLIKQSNGEDLTANNWKEPKREEQKQESEEQDKEEYERSSEYKQPVWTYYNSFLDDDDSHESSYISENEEESDEVNSSEEWDPLGPRKIKKKINEASKKDEKLGGAINKKETIEGHPSNQRRLHTEDTSETFIGKPLYRNLPDDVPARKFCDFDLTKPLTDRREDFQKVQKEVTTGSNKPEKKQSNGEGSSCAEPSYNDPCAGKWLTGRREDSSIKQKEITRGSNKPEERKSNGNDCSTVEKPATQPKTGKFVYNYKPPPPIGISKLIYPGDMTYTYNRPRKSERKSVQVRREDSSTESEVASSEKKEAVEKEPSKKETPKEKPVDDWGGPPTGEKLPWHK